MSDSTFIQDAVLDRVEIITVDDQNIAVEPFWKNVDRPSTIRYCLRPSDRPLAERLKRLIEGGVSCDLPRVVRDKDGKTYVQHDIPFSLRSDLDQSLKKHGY